jgi:hypothetical protein
MRVGIEKEGDAVVDDSSIFCNMDPIIEKETASADIDDDEDVGARASKRADIANKSAAVNTPYTSPMMTLLLCELEGDE